MNTSVVMIAFRRPYYLQPVLESWSKVRGVQDLTLFRISLDASDRTTEMINVIKEADFPVDLRVNNPALTVEINPVESVSAAFREFPEVDFVVLAEEDLLVSSDVLEYMNWASKEFQEDKRHLVVCSHSSTDDSLDFQAVNKGQQFNAWVWGTWRDRWFETLEPTWDRNYSTGDAECPASGWDWNINCRIMPRGGFCSVWPDVSRSQNIGQYEGIHAMPNDFPGTVSKSFRQFVEAQDYRLE